MNFKDRILKKSNLWHLGAIVLFLTIACAYFSPALKGFALKQADIVNYVGMSREVSDFRDNDGEQVLWTNSMFSGMPSTQISMVYEGTWLSKGMTKLFRFGLPGPIFYLFIYFIGFYILSLSLKIKPLIGIIGSVAFGLSSYFIVILEAGHNSKAGAIGLAPLMIAGFIMAYRFKNWVLGVALASAFMMIEVSANHFQITYYMVMILVLMGIVEFVKHLKEKKLPHFFKVTGLLAVGYVLALMVNYGNIFGTLEYAKQTIRGGTELTINPDGTPNEENKEEGLDPSYVTNWSYGHAETFTFMIPNYKGGESQYIGSNEDNEDLLKDLDRKYRDNVAQSNQYWGDQPGTSGPVYIGIIVMFLGFLGLVYSKDKYKWALLSVTLLAVMLSWGSNYVSAFVLLPILLYNVNVLLTPTKQLIFSGINTLILFLAISQGDLFIASSLTDFFLDFVPGYNKFRAVTIILVVAELCVPFLGILFLQRLFKSRKEIRENMTGFYVVSGVFLLFLIGLLLVPTLFNTFISAQETTMIDNVQDLNLQGQYYEIFDVIEEARIKIFAEDVMRSLGFFILGAGIIFAFIRIGFSKMILGAGLVVFILFDLLLVDQRYVNTDGSRNKYEQWIERYQMKYPYTAGAGEQKILETEIIRNPEIAVQIDSAMQVLTAQMKTEDDVSAREKQVRKDFLAFRILNRNTNFRVYEEGNPFNSSYTSYFNKSIGGYHGAKLSRYQDLIVFHISKGNPAVVNMLNTKYFILPERDPSNGVIINSKLSQTNVNAMGNAWLSKNILTVANANDEILAMNAFNAIKLTRKNDIAVFADGKEVQSTTELKGTEVISLLMPGSTEQIPVQNIPYGALTAQPLALIVDTAGFNWIYDSAPDSIFNKIFSIQSIGLGGWDPIATTIVDTKFGDNISETKYSGNGTIEMTAYHPDRMVYKSSSTEKQLAVFSEIYYDGWKAFVDGNEVPVSRVNYVLRAIELPAGDHEIRFEFKLASFEKAATMANIGSIAIVLMLIFGLFLESKRIEEKVEIKEEAISSDEI